MTYGGGGGGGSGNSNSSAFSGTVTFTSGGGGGVGSIPYSDPMPMTSLAALPDWRIRLPRPDFIPREIPDPDPLPSQFPTGKMDAQRVLDLDQNAKIAQPAPPSRLLEID